jgi:hypothetical protein
MRIGMTLRQWSQKCVALAVNKYQKKSAPQFGMDYSAIVLNPNNMEIIAIGFVGAGEVIGNW